jgi:ketosteroid isomerase-like protein
MRTSPTLAALAVVAVLSPACSSENAAAPPPAPVDWHAFDVPHGPITEPTGPTPRERAAADAYARVIASPDFAGLADHLDANARFTLAGTQDARGKEAVVKAHQTLFGAFDKRVVALSRVWRTDNEQTVEWTMSGVQVRDWMGVAATNRPVTFKGITLLFTKDDGAITDIRVYFDVALVKAQLGAPSPKELVGLPVPAAPTGAPQVLDQTHSPEEAKNLAAARATLDALERNDEAAYLATFTDDATVETLERPQPMKGKDDLKAYFKQLHKAISQLDTTVDDGWGDAQYAVVEYFVSGEQIGALGWIPPQRDRVLRLQVVDVMEMRDGKVAHVWRYDNPGQILTQSP